MTLLNIGDYLARFKKLKPPADFVKSEIIKIIKDILGADLKATDITCKGGVIYIKSKNPVLKNEIFIKKEKILEALGKKLGTLSPKEIRF